MSQPISVIVNTQSGRAAAVHVKLQDTITRSGVEASVIPCAGPEIRAAAEHAAARGHVLVAGGGDGTVSTVAAVAMAAGRTFGVIPLGTLNHFARDAGIPLDIDAAVGVIAGGCTRALGIGKLNGRTFVNNVSVGLYPQLVRERIVEQSRGRGKRISLAIALLRTWRSYPCLTVKVAADGVPFVRQTPFVFIGNGEYRAEGLGFGRRVSLDAGRLSIFMAPGVSRAELAALSLRALAGRLGSDPRFESRLASEVSIETPSHDLELAVDGELARERSPLRCRIHPRTLRTLVPGHG